MRKSIVMTGTDSVGVSAIEEDDDNFEGRVVNHLQVEIPPASPQSSIYLYEIPTNVCFRLRCTATAATWPEFFNRLYQFFLSCCSFTYSHQRQSQALQPTCQCTYNIIYICLWPFRLTSVHCQSA
jgi:hypothetical protein